MASKGKLCFIVSSIFILRFAQAEICYSNFTTKINGALYPLDPYGLSGRYAGLWSNYSNIDISQGMSYQVWMLSYNAETPKSFFLALIAIRNPSEYWDLTRPVILWKARQTRLVGENATLQFTADGELKIEEDDDVVWSTKTANRGVRWLCISNRATIMLLDESGSNVIWQSSDEPSDTVLLQRALTPGQKLVSWNTSEDSSDGLYSLVIEKNRLQLLYASQPYWSFGNITSEEDMFAVFCRQNDGIVSLDLRANFSQIETNRDDLGLVFSLSCSSRGLRDQVMELPIDGSQLTPSTFIKLKPDGDVVLYSWNWTGTNWIDFFRFSTLFKCFLPSGCGRYRTCNSASGACEETCPDTFARRGEDCQPPYPLETCEDQLEYRFVRREGADYFSTNYSTPVPEASVEACQGRCESNCTCTAAFYNDGSCFLTHGDVQSLRSGKYVALLKVARPRKISKTQLQAITLGVLVPTMFLLIVCLGWHCRRRNKHDDDEGEEESTLQLSLMAGMPRRFSFQELEEVTGKFSNCLGNGGFGSVFKGLLADGTEVAVKKLEGSNQRSKDFFAEVGILARTHHWNLVKLLGFCAQGPRKRLLVYEYMKNGSLEQWIFEDDRIPGNISWKLRFNIAIGTARGLNYLHDDCVERIIHLDLKPENVLLDDGFQPKIADFGLSKLMDRKESELQLTTTRGTPGYVAPECIQEGTVTEKTDVFGFGVLLLEIITGCKNRNLSGDYLKDYLLVSNRNGSAAAHLSEEENEKERLKNVAAMCVRDDPNLRPSMSKVIQMMEGVTELLQVPLESELNFFFASRPKDQQRASNVSYRSSDKFLNSSSSFTAFSQSSLNAR
ncbi:G-type lectin S-receptor-like serine/threonine-protein kinase SD2-5 [Selaginella moellendorffii]|nr:G-type lectin S-receptor-like serine/threonine-protein kinase SD2-5 [Selaginella moellendorffii]|eukprot:XP_002973195.2 G-type lectin S-receptor-like serine/threonine-protein kinase SD2-5 [Selaginella moellendorffii]